MKRNIIEKEVEYIDKSLNEEKNIQKQSIFHNNKNNIFILYLISITNEKDIYITTINKNTLYRFIKSNRNIIIKDGHSRSFRWDYVEDNTKIINNRLRLIYQTRLDFDTTFIRYGEIDLSLEFILSLIYLANKDLLLEKISLLLPTMINIIIDKYIYKFMILKYLNILPYEVIYIIMYLIN